MIPDPAPPHSFWHATAPSIAPCPPAPGRLRVDVAIIGAGYAGLNAALELAGNRGAAVAVLEAAQPGWGASGRNGGFACLGGAAAAPAAIERRHGPGAADEWAAFERAAVERVRDTLARFAIAADHGPEGEVCLAHSPRAWAAMRDQPGALSRAELAGRGLTAAGIHGGLWRDTGFPLHPLKYLQGLLAAVRAAGAQVHGASPVTALTRGGDGLWHLATPQGTVRADRVLIATNGHTDEGLHPRLRGRLLPVASSVLVTAPLSTAQRAEQGWTAQTMAYDSRRVLHYFRLLPCGRFLFGGRGALSDDPGAQAVFARRLRADMDRMFPAFARVPTEFGWGGLVCLTPSLTPFIGPLEPGLFAALGWHGNGVAAASEGGRRAALALIGARSDIPRAAMRLPRRFPLPALRRPALWAGMALARCLDGPLRGVPDQG